MQGGRGIGRPPSARGADAAAMQNGLIPLASTPSAGTSLGRPYGRKHLAGKLARGTAMELQTMIQMLNLRAAEIAMEMQSLQDLDKDGLGELFSVPVRAEVDLKIFELAPLTRQLGNIRSMQ